MREQKEASHHAWSRPSQLTCKSQSAVVSILVILCCTMVSALPGQRNQGGRRLLEFGKPGTEGSPCGDPGFAPDDVCDPGLFCSINSAKPIGNPGACTNSNFTVERGDKCGGFRGPRCASGLECLKEGTPEFDPGTCIDSNSVVEKGKACSRVTGPECARGLLCSIPDEMPAGGAGICIALEFVIEKGENCGEFNGLKCAPGLLCDLAASAQPSDGNGSKGLCVDETCSKCKTAPFNFVCAMDPKAKKRKTYASRCYAECLKATTLIDGRCTN